MSGTLISSLVWVPRGRAALRPKTYTLDEEEIGRVGKLGGPGAQEKMRQEMEGIDVGEGEWEECVSGLDSASEGPHSVTTERGRLTPVQSRGRR